jgi:DNA-binding NtrC family response regulator
MVMLENEISDPVFEDLRQIQLAVERAADLTRQLLLFSDVVLPDGNGVHLADSISSKNPRIRIILCSGYTDHKSQWPLIQERGFRFLSKPFVLATLLEALRETLETK